MEQNAIASGSKYKSDIVIFNNLRNRYWKNFPDLKIFEEGYDKDYIYEERKYIPILQAKRVDPPNIISNYIGKNQRKMPRIGKRMVLLTMRGAIKFNMWKRTEGGKMIASALIER